MPPQKPSVVMEDRQRVPVSDAFVHHVRGLPIRASLGPQRMLERDVVRHLQDAVKSLEFLRELSAEYDVQGVANFLEAFRKRTGA